MRRLFVLALLGAAMLVWAPAASAGESSLHDRVDDLQQEVESLTEDIEDLREPVEEFDLFDQCMYLIGVTEWGRRDGASGYWYGAGGRRRRPALAFDFRGFGTPKYEFLAFPGEEPPSIECNEDAGEEFIDQ